MSINNIRDADNQINLLEKDLVTKCVWALEANEIGAVVQDVFSLDELEMMMEKDLDGRIGVGVGYQGISPVDPNRSNAAADKGIAVNCNYTFVILLAVPVDEVLSQRVSATTLLTVLRKGIIGSMVEFARQQRTWGLVQERPEVDQSTPTMLFYTQVWQITLPVVGTSKEQN